MWEAKAQCETEAGPEAVWALWENPQRWSEWNDEIASVRADGPLESGSRITIRFKRSLPLRFTVIEWEPGRLFTDEARLPGARLGHEHLVERVGDRTRIQNRLYIDGPAERLYALLVPRSVKRFVERERVLAEAAAAT
jgi:hypothetical protein